MGIGNRLRRNSNDGLGRIDNVHSHISVTVDAQGNPVKHRGAPEPVGSPLLRALAARTWADVTGGTGVTLVDGKPVPVTPTGRKPKGGAESP
jgi:hypothetical protein